MKISATVDTRTIPRRVGTRIWDLPTRLFHWSLVAAISGALLTQYLGGTAMVWHFRFGYATLTLVLFRIIWGFVGTRHARFANFVRKPLDVIAYIKSHAKEDHQTAHIKSPGHNPLGALSVLAMLGAVLLQVGTGLFANDDIAEQGPLAKLIDKSLSDQISVLHSEIGIKLIYVLVALHIAAIAYYFVRKRVNLVHPMVSGDKPDADPAHAVEDGWPERATALACLSVSIGIVWLLTSL
jgi:cytochrome b